MAGEPISLPVILLLSPVRSMIKWIWWGSSPPLCFKKNYAICTRRTCPADYVCIRTHGASNNRSAPIIIALCVYTHIHASCMRTCIVRCRRNIYSCFHFSTWINNIYMDYGVRSPYRKYEYIVPLPTNILCMRHSIIYTSLAISMHAHADAAACNIYDRPPCVHA
jgi:hypothetical protein